MATLLLLSVTLLLLSRRRDKLAADRNRARLETELREGEQRFRLIAESIDEVVWSADTAIEKNFYISPAYERVWGRSRDSLLEHPRSFTDAIHPEDRERVLADHELKKAGRPFDHEYRIVLPDGSVRWIWDRGFPVRDEAGGVVRYVGAAQDVPLRFMMLPEGRGAGGIGGHGLQVSEALRIAIGGDDAADCLRYLVATKSRTISQRKLRGL